MHDVLVVLGIFALFDLDFDLTVLAAVLAVIGYSQMIRSSYQIGSGRTSGSCGPMIQLKL